MSGWTSAQRVPRNTEQELQRFVLAQLLHHDPINLNYGGGAAIYGPDASAITASLRDCRSEADVCLLVYHQLQNSFGDEAAGSSESCLPIARAIWGFAQNPATPEL